MNQEERIEKTMDLKQRTTPAVAPPLTKSSFEGCEQEIDDMRLRLEHTLQNLVYGTYHDFHTLQQQVRDCKASAAPSVEGQGEEMNNPTTKERIDNGSCESDGLGNREKLLNVSRDARTTSPVAGRDEELRTNEKVFTDTVPKEIDLPGTQGENIAGDGVIMKSQRRPFRRLCFMGRSIESPVIH
jgi:hypothetical protein